MPREPSADMGSGDHAPEEARADTKSYLATPGTEPRPNRDGDDDDVRTPGVPNAIPDLAKVSGDQNEERRSTDESGDGPSGPGPDGRVAGDSDRVASGNAAGPGPGSAPVTIGWSKSLARQGTGTNRSARNLWQKAIQASAQIVEEEQAGQAGQGAEEADRARKAKAAAMMIRAVEAMQHLDVNNAMTAWWRCRILTLQLHLAHPATCAAALVCWGASTLFSTTAPFGLHKSSAYVFAGVLALHALAIIWVLMALRVARERTMWRRDVQLGRKQAEISLAKVQWRLAVALGAHCLLLLAYAFWRLTMLLGLFGATNQHHSRKALVGWLAGGTAAHLLIVPPLAFLTHRVRRALAWTRDPNTLEEQAKLPGMKSQEAAAVRAGPGGMDAFRIVRASIRNMESSVAKSLSFRGADSRRQLYDAAAGSRSRRVIAPEQLLPAENSTANAPSVAATAPAGLAGHGAAAAAARAVRADSIRRGSVGNGPGSGVAASRLSRFGPGPDGEGPGVASPPRGMWASQGLPTITESVHRMTPPPGVIARRSADRPGGRQAPASMLGQGGSSAAGAGEVPIRQKAKQGAEEADPEAEVADGRGDEKAAEAAAVGHVIQREVFVRRPSMVQRLGLGWSRSMRQITSVTVDDDEPAPPLEAAPAAEPVGEKERAREVLRAAQEGKKLKAKDIALLATQVHKAARNRAQTLGPGLEATTSTGTSRGAPHLSRTTSVLSQEAVAASSLPSPAPLGTPPRPPGSLPASPPSASRKSTQGPGQRPPARSRFGRDAMAAEDDDEDGSGDSGRRAGSQASMIGANDGAGGAAPVPDRFSSGVRAGSPGSATGGPASAAGTGDGGTPHSSADVIAVGPSLSQGSSSRGLPLNVVLAAAPGTSVEAVGQSTSNPLVRVVTTRDGAVKWLRRATAGGLESAEPSAVDVSTAATDAKPDFIVVNGKRYRRKKKNSQRALAVDNPGPVAAPRGRPESAVTDGGHWQSVWTSAGTLASAQGGSPGEHSAVGRDASLRRDLFGAMAATGPPNAPSSPTAGATNSSRYLKSTPETLNMASPKQDAPPANATVAPDPRGPSAPADNAPAAGADAKTLRLGTESGQSAAEAPKTSAPLAAEESALLLGPEASGALGIGNDSGSEEGLDLCQGTAGESSDEVLSVADGAESVMGAPSVAGTAKRGGKGKGGKGKGGKGGGKGKGSGTTPSKEKEKGRAPGKASGSGTPGKGKGSTPARASGAQASRPGSATSARGKGRAPAETAVEEPEPSRLGPKRDKKGNQAAPGIYKLENLGIKEPPSERKSSKQSSRSSQRASSNQGA